MQNLARSSTEDSMTVITIDCNARSYRYSLYSFVLGMGLGYACVYQWQGLESVISVLCFPRSNPDLRRTEPIVESPLQRTSSGSSSSSSTPSSQPSSQGGSQPGSQAGSITFPRLGSSLLLKLTSNKNLHSGYVRFPSGAVG